jgi:hypothetical protein
VQIIQSGFLNERDRRALTAWAHGVASPCRVTRCAKAQVLLGSGWSRQQVRNAFLNVTSGTSSDASSNWRRKKAFVEASDHAAFRAVLQPARESSRTAMRPHAEECHAHWMPHHTRKIRGWHNRFPSRQSPGNRRRVYEECTSR